MRILKFFFVVVIFLFCCGLSKKKPKNESHTTVIDTYWVLYAIQQKPVSCTSETPPYIIFEPSGRYSGYTGCNQFFGNYKLTSKKLTLDYAGATKKLCFAQQELEADFLKMLKMEILVYKIDKDILQILGGQEELLRFVATDSIHGVERRIIAPANEEGIENEE